MHASTSDSYGTLTFTMKVSETLSPDWFGARYKNNYYLDGSEACVSFSMKYTTDSEGYDSVIPQDAFSISVTDGEGKIIQGYQIMDKAIAGSYNVSLSRGKTSQLYKRYAYSEDCRYLRLTYYSDEVRHDVYFALTYDDPNAEYEEMTLGARNEFVRAMKQKLAALGFLDEKYKSSDYFDNNTLAAVKAAQEKYGMEQTGVADAAFLKQLYSDEGS